MHQVLKHAFAPLDVAAKPQITMTVQDTALYTQEKHACSSLARCMCSNVCTSDVLLLSEGLPMLQGHRAQEQSVFSSHKVCS